MKPLLASKIEDINALRYPLLASPKIDGIRCLIMNNGSPVSRKLKDIPNRYVFGKLLGLMLPGLDGELIVPGKPFNEVSGDIMRFDGEPEFQFYVFDVWNMEGVQYTERLNHLCKMKYPLCVKMVQQMRIRDASELTEYEAYCLNLGYEGVMVRDPAGLYKYGRSTVNEQILLKLKRFEDSEAVIVGVEEEMHNNNTAERDNLGRTKRSSHQANLVGKGTLGAFIVTDDEGRQFKIGTGFTAAQRKQYWEDYTTSSLIGKTVKYRHQPSGAKDLPRFPSFIGFRHTDDI